MPQAGLGEQIGAVSQALDQCPGATLAQVREVATIDLKAEEPGLLAFCATHGCRCG
jgi:cobalt-precorrin 5A hydrolase